MPKSLEDVAHFYLPEIAPPATESPGDAAAAERALALPILTVPVGGRDAVRAAFTWNLTVELARLGAHATLVAPRDPAVRALWPEPGRGPLGCRVVLARADGLQDLARAAADAAVEGAALASEGGIVVVAAPPRWLCRDEPCRALLRWWLVLGTPDRADLCEAYGMAKRAIRCGTDPLVGLVIHGVRRRDEAERAFARVADLAAARLGRAPVSYGLLADDLHVYRAITSRRPIGLEHPQSRAARALRDVAGMLWDDARKMEVV